ncbi:MAG: PQQ-dependent sugar dehydrogenase [Candidatus Eisenbacteria bacterium]|nr:PQQ-dependent sugar dehydrogenase [Candidatus Eisenbacteria bacterium]
MKTFLSVLLLVGVALSAHAQTVPTGFTDDLVAGSLDVPCAIEFAPGGRLLLAEQLSGKVRLLVNGALSATDPVFTVPGIVAGGEQGLLGLALDPQFPARPYLYTHQTDGSQGVRISRWRLSGDLTSSTDGHLTVDPASRFDLVRSAPNAATNHNGGTVQFGPGGYLFVSLGEDATPCAAQDTSTLRGKILRLAVDGLPDGPGVALRSQVAPAGNPFRASPDSNAWLVYANGLRNPFRFQVDMVAQTLVIGDVGQNVYEELDLIDAAGLTSGIRLDGGALAGANFGWPWFEGTTAYDACPGPVVPFAPPIHVLDRSSMASASIISAGAYRSSTPDTTIWPVEYHGDLFFSEYYTGNLGRLAFQGDHWAIAPAVAGQPSASWWGTGYRAASDWRVGPDGSLYYCRQFTGAFRNTGVVRRIRWTGGAPVVVPPTPPMRVSSYPAPARGSATIVCDFGLRVNPLLRVLDVRGRTVRTMPVPGRRSSSVAWDGKDDAGRTLPSGVYWVQLEAEGATASSRIALLQ